MQHVGIYTYIPYMANALHFMYVCTYDVVDYYRGLDGCIVAWWLWVIPS